MILLVSEYLPPTKIDYKIVDERHIVTVFKMIQDLLEVKMVKGRLQKNQFQALMEKLPKNHKARWFSGAALNASEQGMAAVLSTVLSRLNVFLDNRTIQSGTVSRGKEDPTKNLIMIERALMTSDELKSIPKGRFIVMKTGTHPMKSQLRLFLDWGIVFDKQYFVKEKSNSTVYYGDKNVIEMNILKEAGAKKLQDPEPEERNRRSSRGRKFANLSNLSHTLCSGTYIKASVSPSLAVGKNIPLFFNFAVSIEMFRISPSNVSIMLFLYPITSTAWV